VRRSPGAAEACYGQGVNRIIREILGLVWKLFKLLFWKWVKPILGRIILVSIFAAGVIVFLVILIRGF
jgi:hypothetical protein